MIRCRIEPKKHLEPAEEPGSWRATGSDPNFRLTDPRGRKLRGGWIRIEADLAAVGRTKLVPLLYVDDGRGLREELIFRLELKEHGIDDILRVPRRVRGLRLDPLASTGLFRLSEVRFTRLRGPLAPIAIARRLYEKLPEGERRLSTLLPRLVELARETPPRRLWRDFWDSARPTPGRASYEGWIEAVERPNLPSPARMQADIEAFTFRPRISIVMPVFNTPRRWLEAAIRSVQAQSYPDWELCLCDDNSTEPHIAPMLDALVKDDSRIKLHRRTVNGRISAASNDAMALATGAYLTLMDHDDLIPAHALYEFVRLLNEDRTIDFVYSDEDKISVEGLRYEPFFKPDWSPEYLETCMYTSHLALYRADIVRAVGGFRDACNGAQDYDFVLRYTEHARNMRHIPKVLYHWRAIPGSTAQSFANKDYVVAAAVRALADRAARTGEPDIVRPGPYGGSFVLRRKLTARPLVSIVIPSAGRDSLVRGARTDLLANALQSIRERSTYENIEIVVVEHGTLPAGSKAAMARHGARGVPYADPVFNFSAQMNRGVAAAQGEVVVLLNDDTEVISSDWLESMLAVLEIPGVGAVGPRLLFESGEIQHAGIAVVDARPDHVRRGYPGDDAGYAFSSVGTRNYLAVTGACLMLRRADFEAVGGFDEGFPVNYNDVDLCLRLRERGLRTVYCGQAALHHFESRNRARVVDPAEEARFRERWAKAIPRDPYYAEWFEALPPTFELDPARY